MVQGRTRGFAGRTPQKELIWLPFAHSATKSPNPANPPQCGKPAKGVGPVAWSQRSFKKTLGWGVEPLGDLLVEDQETVLSLSKHFPALHSALPGSSQVPRDRGAASEPAASQLLKSSQPINSSPDSRFPVQLCKGAQPGLTRA